MPDALSALADGGNRAEALRAYTSCRELLQKELGVAPSKETEAIATSLLRAGLAPALGRRGAQVVAVGAYEDLDGEILRAASRLGVTPPIPNQSSA